MSDSTRDAVARALYEASRHCDLDSQYRSVQDQWLRKADAVLSALTPGSRFIVDGEEMMVVPCAPSPEVVKAGVDHRLTTNIGGENRWTEDTVTLYRAMLRACEEK